MAQEITWRIPIEDCEQMIEDCEQMIAADLEHIKRLNKSLRYFKLQEASGSPFPLAKHDHDARQALQSYKADLARDLQDPEYCMEYLRAAALDSKEALKGAVTNVMGQAIASAEARARLEEQETAWLAERLDTPAPEYATVDDTGFVKFTADPNEALRFKRIEDARRMAALFEFEDVRAREHMWPEAARTPDSTKEPE